MATDTPKPRVRAVHQSLTRNIRTSNLRPACEACRSTTQHPNAVIPPAPSDETH